MAASAKSLENTYEELNFKESDLYPVTNSGNPISIQITQNNSINKKWPLPKRQIYSQSQKYNICSKWLVKIPEQYQLLSFWYFYC